MIFRIRSNLTVAFALLLSAGSFSAAPLSVTQARAAQKAGERLVNVNYSISGGTPPYTVTLQGSLDGGATWTLPVTTVNGHVGAGVTAGTNRLITWNAGTDWPGQVSGNVKFKVTASDSSGGLIAHYPFDGNSNDASGYGHHGTPHGGLTYGPGVSGSAIQLDGSTGYVKVSAAAASFNLSDSLTLSVWVYPNNTQQQYAVILDKSHSSPTNYTSWVLQQASSSTGRFYFGYGFGSAWSNSGNPVLGAPVLPASAWSHLAVTKSGTSIKYFLNGSYAGGQITANPSISPNGDLSLFIGRFWWDVEPRYFSGKLDEVRIYDRALSAPEIQQLYNSSH